MNKNWIEITDPATWDVMLTELNGHPLQSAKWGESRRVVDGLNSFYFSFPGKVFPLCMARVECRKLPFFGKVAWLPRGPVLAEGQQFKDFLVSFKHEMRQRGFSLLVTDEYKQIEGYSKVRTIWIDLNQSLDDLAKCIDKQWIYGARRAFREGVEVSRATSDEDIYSFYRLCTEISKTKGFVLPGSEALMKSLLHGIDIVGLEMHLFLAKHEGRIGAGVFVARAGSHIHYLWGASDRELSNKRAGEAAQWAVIQWAKDQGCTRYDLEGIDPINNPGVYKFKKKMGGVEISLGGKSYIPLNLRGRIAKLAGVLFGKS